MDISDLTDFEIMKVGAISKEVSARFSHKPNTAKNLAEMANYAEDEFRKIGLLTHVDLSPVLLGEPPIMEIRGRVADANEHKYGFDHERKRHEVLEANARGEKFRGEKESYRG